ncbi:MAG: hypothetical protein CSA22_04220 [Deltaproteobacteria bacterium]|nr:MAG: hypothetical protein CSA22_04220 [Deltaproteobacteria bacterium]
MQHSRYKLLDKLAVGGMAEVHRAVYSAEEGFEKIVVIKRILPHLTKDENLVNAFIDEARLAALLQHENIVKTFDFGKAGDDYFIAMECLSGKSLRDIMNHGNATGEALRVEDALLIISRVCAGLSYAHQLSDLSGEPLNIIHRDISPANIFITYDGQVKVIDFGIAKAESQNSNTQFGTIKGKFSYMSPEQAFEGSIDHRSDIFALGSVMYELLTRRRLFEGDMYQVLAKLNKMDYIPPDVVAPDLPKSLCGIIEHALERNPVNRYQSCAEIRLDIEDCIFDMKLRTSTFQLERHMKEMFFADMEKESIGLKNLIQGKRPADLARGQAELALESTLVMPMPGPYEATQPLSADDVDEALELEKPVDEPEGASLLNEEFVGEEEAFGRQIELISPTQTAENAPEADFPVDEETVFSFKAPDVGPICFQCGEPVEPGKLLCDSCAAEEMDADEECVTQGEDHTASILETASAHAITAVPEPAADPVAEMKKRICVLGAFASGKTNLVQRFVSNRFIEDYTHLAGVNIDQKKIRFEDRDMNLEIWELPGVDPYHKLNTAYLKRMDALVIVADGNRPATLSTAVELKEQAGAVIGDTPFILVVNKSDQSRQWKIDRKQLSGLRRKGWVVHRASAKSGVGVAKAFMLLAEQLLEQQTEMAAGR